MQLWRCHICGDPYLGEERPRNCPFCGAHERHMVRQEDYTDRTGGGLTTTSRENLESTLALEISNARFYGCASRNAGTDDARALFKALARVESEHASLISKALGIEKPPIEDSQECHDSDTENLKGSHQREDAAIHRYGLFLSQATEPRVVEIFSALIAVESDHLELSEKRLGLSQKE